jgi:hypothetical protein
MRVSVAAAAKAMKITRQQLHNVMQGRSGVSNWMSFAHPAPEFSGPLLCPGAGLNFST